MVKKKSIDDAIEVPEAEPEIELPDPEASNREAEHNRAIVAAQMQSEPLIQSGYGVFTFDPDAKVSMMYQGVYADMEDAQRSALSIEKPKDALNVVIPIAYFC